MDELRNFCVINFLRSRSTSDLCRFVFCANITISSEKVLKFFARFTRENSLNNVTGILLVYPQCVVNVLEATEDEIFRICSHFVNAEMKFLGNSKCFPMEIRVVERFFGELHARAVAAVDFNSTKIREKQKITIAIFDDLTKIYSQLIKNLYNFCNELGTSRSISRACLIDKLNSIANEKDFRLPEVRTLVIILHSHWGESLNKFVDDYYHRASGLEEAEEVVWPLPTNQCPPIVK